MIQSIPTPDYELIPPSRTNKSPLLIVPIGKVGAGKSLFCEALADHKVHFESRTSAGSCTQATTCGEFDISPRWCRWYQRFGSMGKPDPRLFHWYVWDTPGLNDPKGPHTDEQHVAQMIDALKNSDKPINVIVFVISLSDCRFSQEIQRILKIFNSVFNCPRMWDQVCIVVTHAGTDTTQADNDAWTVRSPTQKCVRDCFIDLLHRLWDWQGEDPEFPVFFVNSRDPFGPTKDEFRRFIDFACSRASIRVDLSMMQPYRHDVMKQVRLTQKRRTEIRSSSRVLNTRKVTVRTPVTTTCLEPREVDRDVDVWDVLTLGLGWLFRDKRTTVMVPREVIVYRDIEVDESVYKGQVTIQTVEIEEAALITWNYDANEFDTKRLEEPMVGRTVGSWQEIDRRVLGTVTQTVE
jgi:predicted GTPase